MKKIIGRLILWAIILAALAALVIFVGIPLFSEEEGKDLPATTVSFYDGDTAPLVMENEALRFEMDPSTTQFKLTELTTGREWYSNPPDADKDSKAQTSHKEMLQSTLAVSYSTSQGPVEFNNYKYSIQNQSYDVKLQEDGSIRVDYAIGKIEKVYMIPTAITEERFLAFTENMGKDAKKVKNSYALYSPDNLDKKKNKDEIIALYPEVVNQPLYILKSDTKENNKVKLEGYFAAANYTAEDYAIDQELVAGTKESSAAVFNVTVIYRLEGGDLLVEIPYSEIRYKAEYPITYVTPLPMFGAAGTEDEGFLFVPEGGGALINFNNGKLSQNSYYANTYGWDYATRRNKMLGETRNTFPVFGMAKNGGSFLCFMEGPTSYGGVQADISMRFNSYNWVNAKYNVLHVDQYNVSAKTAQLVFMFENAIPNDTIVQRYRFIDSDSYVDMAMAYGNYLREKYPEMLQTTVSEDMPVSIEVIGAIDKTMVKFGLPIDSVVPTTTFQQADEMIQDLTGSGVKNLNVRYAGWANRGVNQRVFTNVNVIRQLGGEKGMKDLIASAKEQGVNLYFDGVNCFAYDSGVFQGFVPFTNAARYTTREQIVIYPYDVVTYLGMEWLDPYYLVKPEYAKQNASNMIKALSDMEAGGVSFRDIGYFLSADYNPKDTVTREQVKKMNIETMLEAKENGLNVMIRMGNDYAVPYADMVTDMDLMGTNYSILDRQVPFYQIALHGMKEYTGKPINLAGDYTKEFLKCVEYGSGLNFTFMSEDGRILQDTTHSGFYSANYAAWGSEIKDLIVRYQTDMAGLNQQLIVNHEVLDNEVTITTYEDGTKVYVNYGAEEADVNGVIIPASDYTVERGSGK